MKRASLLWTMEIGVLIIVIVIWFARGRAQEKEKSKQESEAQKAAVTPLPGSLDTQFPPQAE